MCTDAGLASYENRRFNSMLNRSFIVTQSLKTVKDFILQWAIDPNGWQISGSKKTYNIDKIDEKQHEDTIFFQKKDG